MKGVFEEAVSGGEGIVLASQDGSVRKNQALEELEVVLADGVGNVDGSAGDGARRRVELSARVIGLEHVPVGVDEVPHPQTVVSAVHHVTALEPEGAVGIAGGISAPEIISYIYIRINKVSS